MIKYIFEFVYDLHLYIVEFCKKVTPKIYLY